MSFNFNLSLDLPSPTGTPTTRPRNHAEASALLDARHDAALATASNTLDVAQTILERGDAAAAQDLIAEADAYFAEANGIASLRSDAGN